MNRYVAMLLNGIRSVLLYLLLFLEYIKDIALAIILRIKSYVKDNSEKIGDLFRPLLVYFVYGLLINFSLWQLFEAEITILTASAYGVTYYFLTEELPFLFSTLRRK